MSNKNKLTYTISAIIIFLLGFGFSELLAKSNNNEKIEKKEKLDQSFFEMKTPNETYTLNQAIAPAKLKDFYCRKNKEVDTTYCEKTTDLDRVVLGLKAPNDEVVNVKYQIIVKNKETCETLITEDKKFLDSYWNAYRDMYAYTAVQNKLENLNNKEKMDLLDKIYILRKIPALVTYKYSATCTEVPEDNNEKIYVFTRFAMDRI